jgi:hypothetical protein
MILQWCPQAVLPRRRIAVINDNNGCNLPDDDAIRPTEGPGLRPWIRVLAATPDQLREAAETARPVVEAVRCQLRKVFAEPAP